MRHDTHRRGIPLWVPTNAQQTSIGQPQGITPTGNTSVAGMFHKNYGVSFTNSFFLDRIDVAVNSLPNGVIILLEREFSKSHEIKRTATVCTPVRRLQVVALPQGEPLPLVEADAAHALFIGRMLDLQDYGFLGISPEESLQHPSPKAFTSTALMNGEVLDIKESVELPISEQSDRRESCLIQNEQTMEKFFVVRVPPLGGIVAPFVFRKCRMEQFLNKMIMIVGGRYFFKNNHGFIMC